MSGFKCVNITFLDHYCNYHNYVIKQKKLISFFSRIE